MVIKQQRSLCSVTRCCVFCTLLASPVYKKYTLLCIFQDGGRRHLGFVIRRFWTTHDVPVAGLYVTCQWRSDQLEFIRDIMILPFHDFGWKMPIPANFGDFGIF